jgi:hypothetical protein
MDWLKDKKNQPIVAAGLAVIIIGAAVAIYFTVFAGGGAPEGTATTPTTPTTSTTDMAATPPGTAPMADPMAGAPGAVPGGTTPAGPAAAPTPALTPPGGATPMEVWRADPFLPAGYKPPPKGPKTKPKPPIRDLPAINWSRFISERKKPPSPDLPQPVRRMAGIIVSDRIYAIIESAGKSEIVQPGDVLDDRAAMVERIERDKVILKTMDKVPKYLTVRMASAPRTEPSTLSTGGTGTEPPMRGPRSPRGRYAPGPNVEPMAGEM